MKKKYLSGIVVVVLAITFSSFSPTKPTKTLSGEKWFELKSGGNRYVASDYFLLGDGSTEPSCTGSNVCAKLALPNSEDGEIPDLSTMIDTRYRTNP